MCIRDRTLTIDSSWLLYTPRYATDAAIVTYRKVTLLRKKLVSASAAKAPNNPMSTAWLPMSWPHVSTGASSSSNCHGLSDGAGDWDGAEGWDRAEGWD